jgi:RHS repeat-associated protein
VSAALKPSPPHRIKAAHRRRRRVASGQSVQRYYDPAIGRFLSVDPVGPLQNPINHFGRYHYANNNPYRNTDPDGRAAMDWGERYRATQQLAVDLGGTPQDGNNAIELLPLGLQCLPQRRQFLQIRSVRQRLLRLLFSVVWARPPARMYRGAFRHRR